MTTRVGIAQGELQGRQHHYHQTFFGIPFAKPPVGKLRFCPPQQAQGWSGVRDATQFGASCPQGRFAGKGLEAENLARNMMDAWIAFADGGDPSHPGIGNWKPFERHQRHTMIFAKECLLKEDPFAEERLAIEKLV